MLAKRLTDILTSLSALLGLSLLLLWVALRIKIDSPGPIIFKQKRVGKNGEIFEIYKFRTMRTGTPDLPTDQMLKLPSPITKYGEFLRKTSLDELPQLFNVLAGQMSIVGPRPALYNQTELTQRRQTEGVLRFPPGITGWAQVNGRDELPDQAKVEADKWYCEHWNYWLDWRIIWMTFGAVLNKRGVN
ncbi:MAG: sugar transferase [Candidatus Obscuribacter sp.]|nr:sugar transferase [Candidatus Obscuribacter sp.]